MKKIHIYISLVFICLFISCKKDFLNEIPDKSLRIPTTLNDFQELLNNESIMNVSSGLSIIAGDEFYTTEGYLLSATSPERNSYLWNKDIFEGTPPVDWSIPYQQVFYANVVLDGLKVIEPNANTQDNWNNLKGSALFYRALGFYNLLQVFAKPYDKASAGTDLGIPLRLEADVNLKSTRATVQQTYDQIISDLNGARELLPVNVNYKSRPSKSAAYALLARIYQTMEEYAQAEVAASECLNLNNKLIDYNTLNSSLSRPMPKSLPNGNEEVIFNTTVFSWSFLVGSTSVTMNNSLISSYENDDLRKTLFFNTSTKRFKGNYTGTTDLFSGIATDEVYLIRAECYARLKRVNNAMADLNILLAKRWKTGTFTPFVAKDEDDALRIILIERKKELVTRGLRWADLRRLNKDPKYATTLTREVGSFEYTLLPNSKRYVFPIPDNEIIGSGLEQNNR